MTLHIDGHCHLTPTVRPDDTHARSKPSAQSSETNRRSNRMSPQHSHPVHSEQPAGAVTVGSPQTDTHPMVRSGTPCTPLRVCAPSLASQSGQHPYSLMLNVTVQARSPHTPHGQVRDAVHSPASVRTNPAFQSGPTLSLLLNVIVQAPHTPPMVS